MLKLFSIVGIALTLFTCRYGHAKDISVVGDKYFENGQWDKAVDEYEKLLSKNKNQPGIYFKLGNAYYKEGNLEKALEAFNKATLLKPDYAEAYQRLSEVSMQIGVPEEELKVCL
ncbi:MAG TPA: tetratricopeptide repeat protein, partial [Candidatus Wunengus sp. YC63]|uniref:tetratricopeptide repeat protein n=1 Tax=Candidatus Wunengus sp. YC63 TaxID=3367699 RepID=UPI00402A1DF5